MERDGGWQHDLLKSHWRSYSLRQFSGKMWEIRFTAQRQHDERRARAMGRDGNLEGLRRESDCYVELAVR